MNTKIKFAILGFGHIGKRHADMILRHTEAQLVAIVDTNLNIDASTYKVPTFNTLDQLINALIPVDIVCIATPNYLHCQQAIKALQSNWHVVIEKPMGLSSQECQQVIDTAAANNKMVFCVMQNRYSPPSAWLKEVINQNLLGNIYHVQINCYWNRDEKYYAQSSWKGKKELDGGTLFTQFSHFVDTLYWLFGEIKNITGKQYNFNHQNIIEFEDSGFIQFEINNGGTGSINYSTSVFNKNLESSITIIGQNGSVKIGGQYMDEVLVCNIKDYQMPQLPKTNPANDYGSYKGSAANHEYVIQNVIEVLQGKANIKTTASEGLKVVETIEHIYKALHN